MDMSLTILTFAIGDANWVIQCPSGAAVKEGDFCCSVNGTTKTCCDTPSNGLGLVAAVSSAQAVSATSVGASTVPASISNSATTSSSGSIASKNLLIYAGTGARMLTLAGSPTFTPSRTAPHIPEEIRNNNTGFPIGFTIGLVGVLVLWGIVWAIILLVRMTRGRRERHRPRNSIAAMIKRELERRSAHCRARRFARRQAESNNIAMNELRGRSDDKSGSQVPPTEGTVPSEADGSQARPAEMDAHVAPRIPPPAVAPDNNPLSEPPATGGFWYNANLGSF